jgi:hypothetical protein
MFCFTFLEVMIALTVIMIASGGLGWKMYRLIEKRRFHSDLEQLHSRFLSCHQLAINMQADWKGALYQKGGKWVFEAVCSDHPNAKKLTSLLHSFTLVFKGKIESEFTIDFFSSGAVSPRGELAFYRNLEAKEEPHQTWKLPDMFHFIEGDGNKELGPMHPEELS